MKKAEKAHLHTIRK